MIFPEQIRSFGKDALACYTTGMTALKEFQFASASFLSSSQSGVGMGSRKLSAKGMLSLAVFAMALAANHH